MSDHRVTDRCVARIFSEVRTIIFSMLIYRDCILFFKCLRGFMAPDYLAKKFKKRSEIHNEETRNEMDIPGYRTATG